MSFHLYTGVAVKGQVQVVPDEIESVSGSSETMGCTSPLENSDGVTVCRSQSYLVDGCSPDIDIRTSDWASHLVTVRRKEGNPDISYDHVLLTFGFETAVSPTGIEIDFFQCPEVGIGAPRITVYVNEEYNLDFSQSLSFLLHVQPSQSSCVSLLTVSVTGDLLSPAAGLSFHTFHILVDLSYDPSIQWVYIGDVRFIDGPPTGPCLPPPSSSLPTMIPPSPSSTSTTEPSSVTDTPPRPTSMSSSSSPTHPPPPPSQHTSSTSPDITSTTTTTLSSKTTTMVMSSATIETRKTAETSSLPSESSSDGTPTPISESQGNPVVPHDHTTSTTTTDTSFSTATAPPGTTPPGTDDQALFNQTTTILSGAVVAGMLVLVFVTLIFVIYCCASRKQREPTKRTQSSVGFKESSPSGEVDSGFSNRPVTNPIQCGFPSPLHERYNATSISFGDHHYQGVVTRQRQDTMSDPEYSYAYISLSEAKTRVRFSSVKYDYVESDNPSWSLRRPISEKLEPKKVEAPVAPLPIYNNIPNAASPKFVPKLEASEEVTAPPSPDETVVSERIDPSDFASVQGSSGNEGMPQLFGPVYPTVEVIPGQLSPLQISSDHVLELNEGTGDYGSAVLAVTKGLSLMDMRLSKDNNNRNLSILLAVKKLQLQPTRSEREAFDREVLFMHRLKHPNIVQFIGVCYETPTFLMMEYMEEGDLNQFLQRYSEIVSHTPSSETQIAVPSLIYMAAQIASGMRHLAQLKFIHRDLATRKCFVGSNFNVKLADFGTNTRYLSHYYRIRGNILMPIRWMAPECFHGKFSEKTDVWAFGVTMWELFTLDKVFPYPQLSDEEVIQNALKRDDRHYPSMPAACPKQIYEVIERCWCLKLKQRATFQELEETLQGLK